MIRHSSIDHRFVDDMPERLEPNLLYVSMRYSTAIHLCCCGCGREVVTPIAPAQWHLTFDGEAISLHPSIGSWSLPCRSHYFIRSGRVIPAPIWSEEEVEWGQEKDKRARTAYYSSNSAKGRGRLEEAIEPRRGGWLAKLFGRRK